MSIHIGEMSLEVLQQEISAISSKAFPLTIKLVFLIILLSLCNDEKKKKTLDHEEHPSQALSEAREGWGCIMDFSECMDYNFYTSFLLGHLG